MPVQRTRLEWHRQPHGCSPFGVEARQAKGGPALGCGHVNRQGLASRKGSGCRLGVVHGRPGTVRVVFPARWQQAGRQGGRRNFKEGLLEGV